MEVEKNNHINLPVMAILAAAFVVPWRNKARFSQALAVTFSILVSVDYIYGIYGNEEGLWMLPYIAINSFVYVSFAVACHRLVLLGDTSVPKLGIFGWSNREFRFFLWGLKIALLIIAAVIVITVIGGAIVPSDNDYFLAILFFVFVPFIYLVSRVIPLFPATAMDKVYDYKWAYKLTEGNGLRMMVIVALIPIIMIGVDFLIKFFFDEGGFVEFVTIALGYIVTVFEIAAISLSYDFCQKCGAIKGEGRSWGQNT